MVICKFFQNGNCRFGSKCDNEHFDVKLHIETEVQSAVKCNQWPLSCFGPFKDKPNIPNFIEDQSFEEVRYMCYEAKKQNCFPTFDQQFKTEVMQAQNKMKSLLTWSREVQETIMALYNTDLKTESMKQKNPFTMGNNIFGNTNSNKSVFNSSNTVSFSNTPVSNTSIFGNQNQSSVSGGSIIGQSAFNTGFGNAAQPQSSIFGGSAPAQQSANIFLQNNAPAAGGSIFGQQSTASSMFGNKAAPTTPFGGNAFTTQSASNIFGLAPQQTQVDSGNIFAQAAAQTQPVQGFSSFGIQQQQPQQLQQSQLQTGGNSFAHAMQQPPAFSAAPIQQPQNVFAQQSSGMVAPTFGASTQPVVGNLFGQPQVQLSSQQLPPINNVQVQLPQQLAPQTQPMSQQQIQTLSPQIQQSSIFSQVPPPAFTTQTSQTAQPIFQQEYAFQNQSEDEVPGSNISIYSKMEDLTQQQLECFKADHFVLGQIPSVPPPRELC